MAGSIRAAGIVIFRQLSNQTEYLLLQTSYGHHHWTPPKGLVDHGETDDMTTALRETQEEAGFKNTDLIIYQGTEKTLEYQVKKSLKTVVYWLAQLKDPEMPVTLSEEHQNFKWLDLEAACTLGEYKEMRELLTFYDDYIKKNIL